MEKRWIILTDHYDGIEKNALNMLYCALSAQLQYVLPIQLLHSTAEEALKNANIILVGKASTNALIEKCQAQNIVQVPQKEEGYCVYVGESIFCPENQMIVIAGFDAPGVLYGCMDFCNKYLGDILYKDKYIWAESTFDNALDVRLNPWSVSIAPAIKRRAIWTWGHVIYDYRRFFQNMAKLRLNEVVIWNDAAPLNARDVVEYAHSLNIKVIWGFAWGWDTSCGKVLDSYDDNFVPTIKKQVLHTYETQYSNTGADGIYFQTFTEHDTDSVAGKSVAQVVTELVNDIAASLLEKHPDLHIQFGLHATSVRNRLEFIKQVDPRIYIVWEDCGAFPYQYESYKVSGFEDALAFTNKIVTLRGENEKFGTVLKGMLNLDWKSFEHFSEPYILGERADRYIRQRQAKKDRIWKQQQAGWLRNADCVRQIIEAIANGGRNPIVQALVEDAMFENEIMLPAALYAEMLWTPDRDSSEMIEQVSKYPCVHYANI